MACTDEWEVLYRLAKERREKKDRRRWKEGRKRKDGDGDRDGDVDGGRNDRHTPPGGIDAHVITRGPAQKGKEGKIRPSRDNTGGRRNRKTPIRRAKHSNNRKDGGDIGSENHAEHAIAKNCITASNRANVVDHRYAPRSRAYPSAGGRARKPFSLKKASMTVLQRLRARKEEEERERQRELRKTKEEREQEERCAARYLRIMPRIVFWCMGVR